MYDQILFPTDGSDPTESVLDYALQVASEHGARIHILNVADTNRDSLSRIQDDVLDVLEEEGEKIVAEAAQRATERGISVVSEVLQGDPSTSIVEYSNRSDVDLIVMPTHGRRGLKRFLLGSVTERVINTAEVPVVAVNPDGNHALTYPCQNLLVPIDDNRGAELVLTEGIAVANATGATLHLLHVVETGSLGPDVRSLLKEGELSGRANEIMSDAIGRAATESVDAIESEIEYGRPSKEIHNYIEEHAIDLTVLGTHGETDIQPLCDGGCQLENRPNVAGSSDVGS